MTIEKKHHWWMADAEAGSLQFAVEKWGKHLIEHGFKKSQKHVR